MVSRQRIALDISIDTFILGPLQTNTYVVRCEGDCWVIDPASPYIVEALTKMNTRPSRIVLTHGHGDHIDGNAALKQAFPEIHIACHRDDAPMLTDPDLNFSTAFGVTITSPPADEIFEHGQVLRCGLLEWQVLDTSGHSAGSVSLYSPQARVVFSGDALFAGTVGRPDNPGGNAGKLLKNIRLNLMSLPDETRVLSGHGPETTIGRERMLNPFLLDSYRLRRGR